MDTAPSKWYGNGSITNRSAYHEEETMSGMSVAPYLPFRRVKVVEQELIGQLPSVVISVLPDQRFTPVCSGCGAAVRSVHSESMRWVRDLNLGEHEVLLEVTQRRLRCRACEGTRTEALDFVDSSSRVTKRLARYIADLCRMLSVAEVARHLGLDWKLVKRCDQAVLEEEFGDTDTSGLRVLAVDEIAIRKGHNYMTVVLDYETGRVVWMGLDRRYETLSSFFQLMPKEEREGIEAVAMDMWKPYEKAVQVHLPNARIIYDLFHVVASYNREVLDRVRIAAYRQAIDEETRKVIKGSRYLLYKNEENLTDEQRPELEQILRMNAEISTAYVLKDALKELWTIRQPWAARKALRTWCTLAMESQIPALIRFAGKLLRHRRGIIAHSRFSIHTSRLEGVNNRIKVIKRKAYGFHDPGYFALKVKQAFPGHGCT